MGVFVAFTVPAGREELCLPWKCLEFICLFQIQHVDLEKHFPEGAKHLKEENSLKR